MYPLSNLTSTLVVSNSEHCMLMVRSEREGEASERAVC